MKQLLFILAIFATLSVKAQTPDTIRGTIQGDGITTEFAIPVPSWGYFYGCVITTPRYLTAVVTAPTLHHSYPVMDITGTTIDSIRIGMFNTFNLSLLPYPLSVHSRGINSVNFECYGAH